MNTFNDYIHILENEIKNNLPIDEIMKFADSRGEVFADTDTHLVVRPSNHKSSCNYGQYTRSNFCLAEEDNPSEWDQIDMITQQMGSPAHFYYAFSKKLSQKNKNSIFGIMVYPRAWSDMAVNMSDEELVATGRQRFTDQVGGELAYSDEFLLDWVKQVKHHNNLFESYNSNNKIILPNDLESQLGVNLFNIIINA
jgi:hypothetical protein|tara:strand:+ start:54609 stop:55196 length:588 start_codon:yes stop_codon:yes gene_type:complete